MLLLLFSFLLALNFYVQRFDLILRPSSNLTNFPDEGQVLSRNVGHKKFKASTNKKVINNIIYS